jgi:uncharacterized protein YdeI (YjbR/CyaY-like superfamily)
VHPKPTYFSDAAEFRRWLEKHHDRAAEVIVGFHKRSSGRVGLTYSQALDEALCLGWIDGVRRGDGPDGYTIRFTPRRPRSIWSLVNVRHAERLIAAGRMRPAGLAAFEARSAARTGTYSYENRPDDLPAALARSFRGDKPAWTFWRAQPPGYRRTATWWIVSARKPETRARRLASLIAESAARRRLPWAVKK